MMDNDMSHWIMVLVMSSVLLFALYIHHYLVRLERIGCACAMDFRRTYMQWYTFAWAVVLVAQIAWLFVNGAPFAVNGVAVALAQALIFFATVAYVVFAIQYVYRLRKQKCDCSASVARDIIYIVAILNVALFSLGFLVGLYGALMAQSSRGRKR